MAQLSKNFGEVEKPYFSVISVIFFFGEEELQDFGDAKPPLIHAPAIRRTLTCTAASCRGTATSNGWVCSFRETSLFLRF